MAVGKLAPCSISLTVISLFPESRKYCVPTPLFSPSSNTVNCGCGECRPCPLNPSPTNDCGYSCWHLRTPAVPGPHHPPFFSTVICECDLNTGFSLNVCPSSATPNPHKPIPISASAATSFLHWTSLYVRPAGTTPLVNLCTPTLAAPPVFSILITPVTSIFN